MAGRLGRRVINFANLPIKLLMPSSFTNITEIALKTIPSASKIEIRRVLESLYGFEVDEVHTLNMDGKKKKRGGTLYAHPDYKKAYVTLKIPLSISPDIYPIRIIEEEKKNMIKESKSSIVEDSEGKKSHWLEDNPRSNIGGVKYRGRQTPGAAAGRGKDRGGRNGGRGSGNAAPGGAKFPWSSMRISNR